MLTKSIKYTDFNGIEREEKFLFNLTKAELTDMELTTVGGLSEVIKKIVETQDNVNLIKIFKELILKSYGEKSLDGKRFIKVDDNGRPLSIAFSQTNAYSELYMELVRDENKAADFIKGIIPSDLVNEKALNEQKVLSINESESKE